MKKMKMLMVFLFAIGVVIVSCNPTQSQQVYVSTTTPNPPTPLPIQSPSIVLSNTESRVCNYKNIVFVGGSITAGAGASENSKSYASKIGQWFIDNCSSTNIKNISIGGTGSDFAVYRLEHDLGDFVPDIAFYEFAVNDDGKQPEEIRKHVDALIYKLKNLNPNMIIFSVLTTKGNHMEFYKNGVLPPSVDAHAQAAIANNIPIINVGYYFWYYMIKNNKETQDYLPDGVHPNDLGYQLYFEYVSQFLASYFVLPPEPYEGILENASIIDMAEIASTNCEQISENNEIYLLCNKGDRFSTFFTGDILGVVGRIRSDGGRLECVVDNSVEKTLDFWDNYALRFNRTNYFLSFESLEKTKHELTCTVLDHIISSSAGESQGYTVKLLYLMVNP